MLPSLVRVARSAAVDFVGGSASRAGLGHSIAQAHPIAIAISISLLAGSCASRPLTQPPQEAQLTKAISPPERLVPPEDLPGPARTILRARMASHARDMGALMSAVMILDYDLIEERATGIANDASLARPLTGDASELNSALPEKFFVYQDQLRTAAHALAGAAAGKRPSPVAQAYGDLSQTCVRCHATYRAGQHGDSKTP